MKCKNRADDLYYGIARDIYYNTLNEVLEKATDLSKTEEESNKEVTYVLSAVVKYLTEELYSWLREDMTK